LGVTHAGVTLLRVMRPRMTAVTARIAPIADAREEGEGELDPAHRAAAGLTARTYPRSQQAEEPGSRCGSDQRAVMPPRVRAAGRGFYSVDWAMPRG
jgi:hypothetical protein